MGLSKSAETLGVHALKKTVRIVKARGVAIGHNKSRFASLVLEWWVGQGCPAVNKLDGTMRAEVMRRLKDEDDAGDAGKRKAS